MRASMPICTSTNIRNSAGERERDGWKHRRQASASSGIKNPSLPFSSFDQSQIDVPERDITNVQPSCASFSCSNNCANILSPTSGPSFSVSFMWMMTTCKLCNASGAGVRRDAAGELAAKALSEMVSDASSTGSSGGMGGWCAFTNGTDEIVSLSEGWGLDGLALDCRARLRCELRLRRFRTSEPSRNRNPLLWRLRLRKGTESSLRPTAWTRSARTWSSAMRWRGARCPNRVSSDWESS